MKDPGRLFRCYKENLQTAALYFNEANLVKIGPDKIGRLNNMSTKKKRCIKYICSLQLKFGNGLPVYRVLRRDNIPFKLVNIQTTDGTGRKWVTSWRLAGKYEMEWWP